MNQDKFPIKRKIISITILGETAVGKTQIYNYFSNKKFDHNNLSTIGYDVRTIEYKLKNDQMIKIKLWDTAGQEKYKNVALQYIKNTHGIIFVYDITNRESFNQLSKWIKVANSKINLDEIPTTILGNKLDLNNERIINTEEGEQFAKNLSASFFETSAKDGTNIDQAFDELINKIYENIQYEFGNEGNLQDNSFTLTKDKEKKKNKCCNKEKKNKTDDF